MLLDADAKEVAKVDFLAFVHLDAKAVAKVLRDAKVVAQVAEEVAEWKSLPPRQGMVGTSSLLSVGEVTWSLMQ